MGFSLLFRGAVVVAVEVVLEHGVAEVGEYIPFLRCHAVAVVY